MTGGICTGYDGRLGPGMGDACRFDTCTGTFCQRKANERLRLSEEERQGLLEGTATGPNLNPLADRLWTEATAADEGVQARAANPSDGDPDLLALWRLLRDVSSRADWFDVGDMSRTLLMAAAAREWLRVRPKPSVRDIQVYIELMNPAPGGDMPATNPNGHQIELVLMALRDMEK